MSEPARQAVVGLLAHVDAGKTTLAEGLLYHAGAIRVPGRVDHRSSHLDTNQMERDRGITIFSKQAHVEHHGTRLMLLDAPGHVDFSAEAERTLQVLDLAVLVIGANDGVQGHTETMWRLLARYDIPVVVFVNKTDLALSGRHEIMGELQRRLDGSCVECPDIRDGDFQESAAMCDETALVEYLDHGELSASTLQDLVSSRSLFPCFFGSALKDEGVDAFLDALCELAPQKTWPDGFGARVYKVSRGQKGERIAWLKVTGGCLRPKDLVSGVSGGRPWEEKVDQVRVYSGDKHALVQEAPGGWVCAVTGLTHVVPGDSLGSDPSGHAPYLEPVITYGVLENGEDPHAVLSALRVLAEEDPQLGVSRDERLQQTHVRLMGAIQLEVVAQALRDRFGLDIDFGTGGIVYRETISEPVMGYGHFEPLRHYAEAHLLLEPLPRGTGVKFGTICPEDDLDRNWQRLILTNAMEREHLGVLTGSPITDVRITLVSGRAHAKHTEGGDFRQATYRAIRQGLMSAKSVLLEPWYHFSLEVPQEKLGRALSDLTRMSATFGTPTERSGIATVEGTAPVSEMQEYALEVIGYTAGRGHLFCELDGYRECHDAEKVIEAAAYEPESDLPNTPDSVFCSHGAGYTVKWHEAKEHMHVKDDPARSRPWREADESFFSRS